MKADKLRAQVTVPGSVKAIAIVIAVLMPYGNYEIEKMLRTVCAHFGFRLEK